MEEKNKKIKQKKFIDSSFVKWAAFVSSLLSILGLIVGGAVVRSMLVEIKTIQNNNVSTVINNGLADSRGQVAGAEDIKDKEDIPSWEDKRGMFSSSDDGYNCIKKKWSYNDQYYFLWDSKPLPAGKTAIIQLSAIKNISKSDLPGGNDSIVIAYADPENQNPLYEMFFPASEKKLIGFNIDGESTVGSISPQTIRFPLDVYKGKFEIEYGVNFFEGSNEASFNYNLTYMPDDGYEKQAVEAGHFTVPMSVNPQNGKPFIIGIGVHRDGPCFRFENFKIK